MRHAASRSLRALTSVFAAIGTLALVAAFALPASATQIDYSLNLYVGSGTAPSGPYGDVVLDDSAGGAGNVLVTFNLIPGFGLTNTGAGAALTFQLSPLLTPATITGLSSNFSISHNGTSTGNLDGTGTWDYEIDCAVCGSGGSKPFNVSQTSEALNQIMQFTIDNVTLTNFVGNNKGFFAADVCTAVSGVFPSSTCGTGGLTGDILSTTDTEQGCPPGEVGFPVCHVDTVPEPASMTLLGAGAATLAILRRRRRT
jgi:hypothetical protein